MKTKILTLLTFGIVSGLSAFAQVRTDISLRERNNSSYDVGEDGYNARSFSVGVGLGMTKLYGDMSYSNPQPAYIGYFEKNIISSVSYGWTVTVGDLSSRDPATHFRAFNHFTSVDQHITVELGTLFHGPDKEFNDNIILRLLGGIYVGGGLGIINNDIKRISYADYDNLHGASPATGPIQLQNSVALYMPLNFGINLHLKRLLIFNGCVFNANFQYTPTMSDYIDGFKLPFAANKRNDVYTVMSVGFRFYIMQPSSDY